MTNGNFVFELDAEDAACLAYMMSYWLSHCLYNFKLCKDKETLEMMASTECFFRQNMAPASQLSARLSFDISKYLQNIRGDEFP